MESLESLMSVARGVLKEENQGHVDESDANENINGTPKQVYLSISYSKKSVSTSKSKIFSSKHSLRPFARWVKKKDRTNRRDITVDTENSKSSEKIAPAMHFSCFMFD